MRVEPPPQAPSQGSAWNRPPTLVLVLATLLGSLAFGVSIRASCVAASADRLVGQSWCLTQVPPLYVGEQLTGSRLPYVDPCHPVPGQQCDEYPVLTMYAMRLASYAPGGLLGFYWTTVALFCLAALVVAVGLERVAGMRALFFTAAPALWVLGFMNWDLLGVAFGAVAVLAYLRRRDRLAAVAVGLGTAVKLFPALLAIPFVIGRVKEGDRRGAARLVIWSGGSWLVVNLPFAATAFSGWSRFFRFNSTRPADIDSLWYIACRDLAGRGTCVPTGVLDLLSVGFFVAASAVIWRMKTARDPDIPAWTFGFPFLVVFFLTNKVYSPQYDLWLLMWFVLVLPDLRLFVALQLADLAIVVTRYAGFGSPPLWTFHSATLIRDAVLVACMVAFVRRPWQTQVGLVRPRSGTTSTSSHPGV